jgi:hypothetical protein
VIGRPLTRTLPSYLLVSISPRPAHPLRAWRGLWACTGQEGSPGCLERLVRKSNVISKVRKSRVISKVGWGALSLESRICGDTHSELAKWGLKRQIGVLHSPRTLLSILFRVNGQEAIRAASHCCMVVEVHPSQVHGSNPCSESLWGYNTFFCDSLTMEPHKYRLPLDHPVGCRDAQRPPAYRWQESP